MINRIRELRKAKGITMKQLGIAVGVAESTISQYELGRRQPDQETLIKLSNYLGVTVGYIIGAEKSAPVVAGKYAFGEDINLTQTEIDLIHKFRQLDERGRSTVINTLEHEYSALPQATRSEGVSPADNSRSILRIAARDGSYQERILSNHQVADLQAFLDQLPDVPEGL